MKKLVELIGTAVGVAFIIAFNVAFILWAFPDSLPGRFIDSFWAGGEGIRHSSEPVYRTFQCNQSIPDFTLNEFSDPTPSQLERLCSCIWNGMSENAQALSRYLVEGGPQPQVANPSGFYSEFGMTIMDCSEV